MDPLGPTESESIGRMNRSCQRQDASMSPNPSLDPNTRRILRLISLVGPPWGAAFNALKLKLNYLMTLATTPAPTVRPPSRMAKRRPSAIAIGLISVTTILMLSPGMTISTPSGSTTAPVTSVVRK
jgi:hypothetical protein